MAEYESILCVKNECFVYKIPPRATNRGYRASDWKLGNPDFTGRMKVIAKGSDCFIKIEDKTTGQLFAQCPVDTYPGICVESVVDSSRYFVIRIKDDSGRSAFVGMGFGDRSDSFDFNVALQDHFKWIKQSKKLEEEEKKAAIDPGPKLNLGFKEGQTITINIGSKKPGGTSRPKPAGTGSLGLLPPPPGGVRDPGGVAAAPPSILPPSTVPIQQQQQQQQQQQSNQNFLGDLEFLQPQQPQQSGVDLLSGLTAPPKSTQASQGNANLLGSNTQNQKNSEWGDFTAATDSSGQNWVEF